MSNEASANPTSESTLQQGDHQLLLVTLQNEGRFNPKSLAAVESAIERVTDDTNTHGLVFTGEGKVFAQGLDLEYLQSEQPDAAMQFVHNCLHMIGKLLVMPVPVISAINGHAFGLGAMIAMASDYKAMRADRGFFCMPEIDMGMNLIPSMNALVCGKLSGNNLRDVLLAGSRIGGADALKRGMVDACSDPDQLIAQATALAEPMLGKPRQTLSELKRGINQPILDVIAAGGQ